MIDAAGLRARAQVLAALHSWFAERGYLEVPTPVRVHSGAMEEHLHPLPSGDHVLRTSPEFALKRVLAAGLPRIYEIGPCFRGREDGAWHATEFTMLEWYRVGAGLPDLMAEVVDLVNCASASLGGTQRTWERLTVAEAFERAGVELDSIEPEDGCWDTAFFRTWVHTVEPSLPPRCFVQDWPASQAALAEIRTDGAPRAERFEAYLNGVELANAFLELRDSDQQRARFEISNLARRAAGEPSNPVDEQLVAAVGRLPPVAGIALGVDRLVATLLNAKGIDCVRVS